MAYLSPFGFDIFISYARVNDIAWPGTNVHWVAHFKACLETALAGEFGRTESVNIWYDTDKVGYGMHFDGAIKEGIEQSAVFVALLSNGYMAEESYCSKELECFHTKAQRESYGLKLGHRDRIINVKLQNIPHTEWPEALAGREGIKFHDDAPVSRPVPPGPLFDEQFAKFFGELVPTLRAFKTLVEARREVRRAAASPGAGSQTVFMGYVEGPLRGHRRRAIEKLKLNNVNVIADIPPPRGAEEHAQRVADEIGRADLAVHLLEEEPGAEIEGTPEKFYSREQAEIGQRVAKSQLIWVPKTLDIEAVEDADYREFLTGLKDRQADPKAYKFIPEAPTRIADEILAQLELLKQAAVPPPLPPGQSVALLDMHWNDSRFIADLGPVFSERHVELRLTSGGEGPESNMTQFNDSLKQASVLVIIFGQVASEWVCQRIVSVQQFFVKEQCPLKLCAVYIPPVNGSDTPRRFECETSSGPLQVARFTNPQVLRTLLEAFT